MLLASLTRRWSREQYVVYEMAWPWLATAMASGVKAMGASWICVWLILHGGRGEGGSGGGGDGVGGEGGGDLNVQQTRPPPASKQSVHHGQVDRVDCIAHVQGGITR